MAMPRLSRAALLTATITAVLGATTTAAADLYERTTSSGVSVFSASPKGAGWSRVSFPARRRGGYRRAPRSPNQAAARAAQIHPYIVEAARLYHLPVAYIQAVVHVESHYDPNVISVDGAMGLMQLMPFTAQRMGVTHPFDARQNILGGARFLRILANKWRGDLVLTTASYNAGAGAVAKYRGVPPYRETQRYVRRVLHYYRAYAARSTGLTLSSGSHTRLFDSVTFRLKRRGRLDVHGDNTTAARLRQPRGA